MSCCEVSADGSGGGVGVACGSPICINVTTTDATVQTINIGTLAAVGAGLTFRILLQGTQDNGQRGLFFEPHGNSARNAIGNGTGTPIFVGPTGYIDAAAVPWTTVGVPAGWAAALAIGANVLSLMFNGAAGQNVHWRGMIERWAHNGATLA